MRLVGGFSRAIVLALLALACIPALAAAETPNVTITSPPDGSVTSSQTPSFSGTTNDVIDEIVLDVYSGPTATGTPVEVLSSFPLLAETWFATATEALPDDTYTVQASQTNLLLETGTSTPVTFTVDTVAPKVSLASVLSPTNDATPSFSGKAGEEVGDLAPVTLRLYSGSVASGSPARTVEVVSGGGAWTAGPVSKLGDGTYTAQAEQLDEAGNVGLSAPVTFTVDTTAPDLVLSAPVNGSLTGSKSELVEGSAGVDSGDSPSVTVELFAGSSIGVQSPLKTVVAPVSGGRWAAAFGGLSDGTYTVRAEQSDEAGNIAQSETATFTVDTVAPVVSLAPVASPSNDATPNFNGKAGVAAHDMPSVTLSIYSGSVVSGSPVQTLKVVSSGGAWVAGPVAKLADGTYTAQAQQADEAGNVGSSSSSTFKVDTKGPAVTLTPVSNLLATSTPSFKGGAGVATGDIKTVKLQIYSGAVASGGPAQTLEVTPGGSTWSAGPVASLQDGTYTAQAEQSDEAGNLTLSAPSTFRVDTTPPDITLSSPANGSLTNSESELVEGSAGTAEGDSSSITIELFTGSTIGAQAPIETVKVQASNGHWSATLGGLSERAYTVRAEQSDEAGNSAQSAPATFTVDKIAPTVSFDAIPTPSSDSTPSFSGSAGVAPGDFPAMTVNVYQGTIVSGSPLQTLHATAKAGAWKTGPVSALADGTYTAQAEQSNAAGNTGKSRPMTFTISTPAPVGTTETVATTPPPAPAPADSPPTASFTWLPSAPLTGESVALVSNSTDASSPIAAFAWSLSASGAFQAGASILKTTFSTPGSHVVRLRVVAADGLSSVATETIPVVSPRASLMQPFPIVRIAGTDTSNGAKLRLLTVQAPSGARITVSCRGRGCPLKTQSRTASSSRTGVVVVEFRRFERALRAGTIVEIRVSRIGQIGKYTRFQIRRGKLPERLDTCLSPAGIKPIACPS